MSREQALTLARDGYRVFPVRADKRPLVQEWKDRASADERPVRSLWDTYPAAGVGIATGGGLVVVDLDCKNGADGVQAFTEWADEHGVQWEPTTTTRSGGQHVYFRAAEPYRNRVGVLPGVDVRGDGGYVVAYGDVPPLAELPPLPYALARLLHGERTASQRGSAEAADRQVSPKGVRWALSDECDRVQWAPEGQRNHTLNAAAYNLGQLIGDHLDEDEARAELLDAALESGLESDEALATIDSGLRSGMANPRTVVERSAAVAGDGTSWAPLPLDDVIEGLVAGTLTRPQPAVGQMSGGGALFYPGKVNGIAGPSGEGKSWVAMLTAHQEMEAGHAVVYLDFEDGIVGVLSRFLDDLGTAPEVLRRQFTYVHPEERLSTTAAAGLAATIRSLEPSLVVVDSTGESMALEGAKPNDDDETARWFRHVPQRIASLGPAVLVVDHVVKSDDGGLWPIGSQRKRAAINGAQYIQRVVEPFSRGNPGHSKLVCAKDRHGNYAIGDLVGTFRLTDAGQFELHAAVSHVTDEQAQHQQLMRRAHEFIEANPRALAGDIREALRPVKDKTVDAAVRDLIKGRYVSVKTEGRAKKHTVEKPFVPEFEGGELL